jgi:hypothetical protein
MGRLIRPGLPRETSRLCREKSKFERLEQSSVALVSRANSFESQTICTKANALEVVHRTRASRPGRGGCKQSPLPPQKRLVS